MGSGRLMGLLPLVSAWSRGVDRRCRLGIVRSCVVLATQDRLTSDGGQVDPEAECDPSQTHD